ncbi:hypothetical protein Leryth_006057 [Lithospermum erythrorhizon]|nr:hypothetical protein Leryth_006057 [Lithospermum erythrorhizon]
MTEKHSYGPFNPNLGCAILTVGVDAEWRVVSCAHLEEEDMKLLMLGSPVTSTVKLDPMDNEQRVDYNKEVMGVPKGIESSELVQRLWQVDSVSPEPWRC